MPLSEHEQRVLEQMEHAMETEDPKFATAMRGRTPKARQRRRIMLGSVGVVAGLVLVVVGVAQAVVPLAVAGFVLMLAAGALALTPPRRHATRGPVGTVADDGTTQPRRPRPAKAGRAARPARQPKQGTFMQRLEQRWDRRRDQGGGWGG
ncbi:hypothetical protein GCM10027446_26770 [Angustibacter peucedani]